MKKLLLILSACLSFSLAAAEQGLTLPNDELPVVHDEALIISQQRGMQVYMNNCMGCHALEFQRYNRTAADLMIPQDIMLDNLIFSDAKIGDLMKNNMQTKAAANWFGAAPPDLSVVSRARGTHWLYNYLRGFYSDDSRPYGVNNSVFADVAMPHVLETMQGLQVKTETVKGLENDIGYAQADIAAANKAIQDGGDKSELSRVAAKAEKLIRDKQAELVKLSESGEYFKLIKQGQLTPAEFDGAMADLVYFLDYIGEPIKQERKRLGLWVLLYIVAFGAVAYLLKKEYWKDIH